MRHAFRLCFRVAQIGDPTELRKELIVELATAGLQSGRFTEVDNLLANLGPGPLDAPVLQASIALLRGDEAAALEASVESGLFQLPLRRTHRRTGTGSLGSSKEGTELVRELWDELEERISTDQLPGELEDAVDAVFPTRFWSSAEEPISPTAKRHFGWLWEQAENLKCDLFHEAARQTKGVGLRSDTSPVEASTIPAGSTVLDAVYDPRETRLLRDAAACGARTVQGKWMLVYQAAAQLERWSGQEAPVDVMAEAFDG